MSPSEAAGFGQDSEKLHLKNQGTGNNLTFLGIGPAVSNLTGRMDAGTPTHFPESNFNCFCSKRIHFFPHTFLTHVWS